MAFPAGDTKKGKQGFAITLLPYYSSKLRTPFFPLFSSVKGKIPVKQTWEWGWTGICTLWVPQSARSASWGSVDSDRSFPSIVCKQICNYRCRIAVNASILANALPVEAKRSRKLTLLPRHPVKISSKYSKLRGEGRKVWTNWSSSDEFLRLHSEI